ncbi:MAG TPA: LUD domain-containing protein [Acidobacteriaceae bacterium]|nr:LUD domain-containing protein [Acidobacteriaceae bacterium]
MTETPSAARAAILGRIRKANSSVQAGSPVVDYAAIAREYQQLANMGRAAVLETFAERLREYDARVYQASPATVAETIRTALGEYGQQSALVADAFPKEWLPEGFDWRAEADVDVGAMEKAEGAVVTCEVAIAHTGTIVLKDARRLTLLPDRLLCVVREEQVVETVPEAFARLQAFATEALTFVSGPSATADIEMTRIRGVHGPRFLDVVLV